MKTAKLSRSFPKAPSSRTVVVETGIPEDRLEGYVGRKKKLTGLSGDERKNANFTGADARAALVGQYSKKNRKRFKPEKGESMRHERSESKDDDDY
jgi:hypothetical protein